MRSVQAEQASIDPPPLCALDGIELERRNDLIMSFRPYVIRVARSVVVTVPTYVELDDLIGWGYLGLIEAADRFDESRGVPFRSFAHYRIKGAIYDGLRREFGAHVPSQLSSDEADSVTPELICGDAAYAGGSRLELYGLSRDLSPDHHVWIAELIALVDEVMDTLSPIERDVLRHRYFLDKPIVSLAGARNFSKSWLSRIHARAIAKLRAKVVLRMRKRGAAS